MDNNYYPGTYFSVVPPELIAEILKYTTIEDCYNFCEAFGHARNFRLIKINKIDLVRCYKVNLYKVPSIINCNVVTSVNLNHCHWLSKATLYNFISQLPNVQIFSALETKLDLTGDDIEILNKTKIHRLAVTLKGQLVGKKASLCKIRELYLEINKAASVYFQTDFNESVQLPNVEKIWIKYIVYKQVSIETCLSNCNEDKLKSVTIWYPLWGGTMPDNWRSLQKYYEKEYHWSKLFGYENFNCEIVMKSKWDVLGPEDARKIYFGDESLKTMKCKELLLEMGGDVERMYRYILTNHADSIEIFRIRYDRYRCEELLNCDMIGDHFNRMINIKQLAVYGHYVYKNLHFITTFTTLKFLHVDTLHPKHMDFLPVVFQNCISLEKLSLGDRGIVNNDDALTFLQHFDEALKHANNLKEFFFRSYSDRLKIDDMITIFNRRKEIKLLKLWIVNSSDPYTLNEDPWKKYFHENEQLMDCLIGLKHQHPSHDKIAKELCKLYERPYRKLRFGSFFDGDFDLRAETCNNISCSMEIDDDFFMNNN